MELTQLLDKLEKVKKSGDGKWMSLCPAHQDKDQSLSITADPKQIAIHCFAGCQTEAVLKALGLQMADLFTTKISKARIVKTYDYTDETGKLLFQVCRLEPKSFRQRHKNGAGEWVWDMKGIRRVLYHLPEVIKAPALYFVEGEKDADNLTAQGVVATTSPGGANAWKDGYAAALYNKRVVLIPDNDPAGHAYAGQVAGSLRGKATVSCILLPCKDVSDWLSQGHDVSELPKMEQPIIELLWGVVTQLQADNQDAKRRLLRIEQVLQTPKVNVRMARGVGVKID